MALKKLTLRIHQSQAGVRLDQALADWLPQALGQPVSKAKVRKLIIAGAVYLNAKRVRIASKELRAGAKVDAYVDFDRLMDDQTRRDQVFKMGADRVLFEDESLIVVDKPAGLPTQPTLDEARDNLFAAVKKFLARRDSVVDPYVGLHHRLDRDTSGVVLFTKRKEANAGVAEMFKSHHIEKVYQALAVRPERPPVAVGGEWKVKNYLGRLQGTSKRAKFGAVRSGGDPAETDFRLMEDVGQVLHVEARPRTGRTHQIRVHLSESGMSILGDDLYANGSSAQLTAGVQVPRLMLHAERLEFRHPVTGREMAVRSPLPEDFQQVLRRLKSES